MTSTVHARPLRRRQADRVAEAEERVMRAALELIAERGYERTTATDIGARAGYSRAILRQRFGSKEELLEALFASKWRPGDHHCPTVRHRIRNRAQLTAGLPAPAGVGLVEQGVSLEGRTHRRHRSTLYDPRDRRTQPHDAVTLNDQAL